MKVRTAPFAFLLTILAAAAPALAQDEGDDGDRQPVKVPSLLDEQKKENAGPKVDTAAMMRRANDALKNLKSVSYHARCYGVGGLATRSPFVEADVKLARGSERDPIEWKFIVDGTARKVDQAEEGRFSASFDGKTVRIIRHAAKEVVESAWSTSDDPMKEGPGWAITWAARWNNMVAVPFGNPDSSAPTRYEGEALVNGERCDVVYVDYSESNDPTLFDAWWYLSKADGLPRRLDMHFIDTGSGDGFAITEISRISSDAPVSSASLATPEGYTVRSIKEPESPRRGGAAPKPAGPQVGQVAPEWALKDPAGKEHKLVDYRGKVVVLDFWATWCGPCRAAMPGIQAVHEKYKGKPVEIFGLNCWENADPVAVMKQEKFTYGLLLNADEVAGKYGVSGIPTIYVIGPDGKILYSAIGFQGEDALERAIDQGLAK